MIIKINFENDQDRLGLDASLSLGWISIISGELEVCFFRKGYCMVFLTLTELVRCLNRLKKEKTVQWVGEDNGAVLDIMLVKNQVCFTFDDVSVLFPVVELRIALKEVIESLLQESVVLYSDISNESAFEDLSSMVKSL